MTWKSFKFTPDMFINEPYTICPNCKTNNLWVLMVSWKYCSQRCKKCFYDDWFELPQINKKIIYLDQFVVSNLMKSIDKSHPSYWKDDLIIWKTIFEKLDKLLYLRLIICPYSDIHETESVLMNKTSLQVYESLKRMYHHLSYWKWFSSIEDTKKSQLYEHFKSHIEKYEYNPQFDIRDIIHGNINEWCDNIYITINSKIYENAIDDLFNIRNQNHEWISDIFNNVWKKEKKDFNYRYILEVNAHWKSIFDLYLKSLNDQEKLERWEVNINDVLWSILWPEKILIHNFFSILEKNWIKDKNKQFEIIIHYLLKEDLSNIPYINISSALRGQIGYLAWINQIWEPNRWMSNDIKVIATYLPYIDSMFIDWGLKRLITDDNVKNKIWKYWNNNIFSSKKEDLPLFLNYLDNLEKSISDEHLKYVKKAYWEYKWPYESMYNKE
jgi:hypothetical protein